MPKYIRDPIYKFIEVPDDYIPIVDHKIIQRLRWVSQLPLEQLVYPAAQHSRFEHSIGTMNLARLAAERLIENSKAAFNRLSRNDYYFRSLGLPERKKTFIHCAGLLGLLHDIGHAPFSHTMEDACKHAPDLPYKYNHENIGYHLAKRIIDDVSLPDLQKNIILCTLNKTNKKEDLPDLVVLLRDLIDGPIDVDKGDYLLRDSYHCGVVYGIYDYHRLWNNIIITDTHRIGINTKGALESWSLRIARYKMNVNVYKHHIRNITDALLIEIITLALQLTNNSDETKRSILPVLCDHDLLLDEKISRFCFWNDNTILHDLNNLEDAKIKSKIENFTTRKLYKRCIKIDLTKDYPESIPNQRQIHNKMLAIKINLAEKNIFFNYIIDTQCPPPIYEDEVQKDIRIKTDKEYTSLSNYLGFFKEQPEKDDSYIPSKFLRIFTERKDPSYEKIIYEEVNKSFLEFTTPQSISNA